MADNTFLAPLSPIQRSTPAQNLISFQKNEYNLYNKFSPYYQAGGDIGPDQPYIYTKLTDSTVQKDLTKYDTRALPVGSTVRDVIRMTKFSASGTGLLYTGKQLLLQQQNAYNETRVYNPISLLKATAKPGSAGLIDYPQRHLETSGGLLNFFKDALLSTFGFSTRDSTKPIEGTASGDKGDGFAYSNYVFRRGSARFGLLRFNTGNIANSKFKSLWGVGQAGGGSGGLQRGFLDRLRSLIPSTNPLGAYAVNQFGQRNTANPWKYRPEYDSAYQEGIYFSFLEDRNNFLISVKNKNSKIFYNDSSFGATSNHSGILKPTDFHRYTPGKTQTMYGADDVTNYYAPESKITPGSTQIENTYLSMLRAIQTYNNVAPQQRKSTEGYRNNPDKGINNLTDYNSIPNGADSNNLNLVEKSSIAEGPYLKYIRESGGIVNSINIDNRGFAKAQKTLGEFNTEDKYNVLDVLENGEKNKLFIDESTTQSKDIIFFYFYDLINKKYIPFRATLGSINDQHSPDWEDIKYIGRADKLYIYKGFSRDVSFNFKVYANSILELVPMWKRINYLVGLTRPSKYTGKGFQTSQDAGGFTGEETDSTGLESGFIYPPMIEFRIGDLYVDQPGILRSVSVSIPDDAQWETLRDDTYKYIYGIDKTLSVAAKSRQLPTIVDVAVQLSIIEREKSLTGNNVFGPQKGWDTIV